MYSNKTKRIQLKIYGNLLILELLKSNKFIYIYMYIKQSMIINIKKFEFIKKIKKIKMKNKQ